MVLFNKCQPQGHKVFNLLEDVAFPAKGLRKPRRQCLAGAAQQLFEQLLLALKIAIQGALCHARRFRDVVHGGRVKPPLGKYRQRCVKDNLPFSCWVAATGWICCGIAFLGRGQQPAHPLWRKRDR